MERDLTLQIEETQEVLQLLQQTLQKLEEIEQQLKQARLEKLQLEILIISMLYMRQIGLESSLNLDFTKSKLKELWQFFQKQLQEIQLLKQELEQKLPQL